MEFGKALLLGLVDWLVSKVFRNKGVDKPDKCPTSG
jgi:hypothetical protein